MYRPAAQIHRESKPEDRPHSGRAQCKVRKLAAPGSHPFSITTGEKPFSGWIPAGRPCLRVLQSRRFEFLILNLNNLFRVERLQWRCKPSLGDDRWNNSGPDDRPKENRKLLSIDNACVEAVERRACPERPPRAHQKCSEHRVWCDEMATGRNQAKIVRSD